MGSERKPCPFHGVYDCSCYPDFDGDLTEWNTRPAEDRLRKALEHMLARYIELVDSGDCGFWDHEKESQVIAASAALKGED